MLEKIKDFLSTLEVSQVLFFLGFLMFGSSMSLYISSCSGTTAGVMFGGGCGYVTRFSVECYLIRK